MSLVQRVPPPVRRYLKRFTRGGRLARLLSPHLPEAICVDVGASYYPHSKWRLFLESPQTRWIAVEPNAANLGYLEAWPWRCAVSACTTGLSRDGGPQTLYVTNVDSGSSLLEPVIPASLAHRVTNRDYFFPLRTQRIETLSLAQVIPADAGAAPVLVKLDTQGTELDILAGAESLLKERRVVGVDLEATLLAEPVMKGGGKFWEACRYLEDLGFELLHIKPIYGPSRLGLARPRGHTYLNECDAVFALRSDVAQGLPVEGRAAMLALYLCNDFFEEALGLLERDEALRHCLAQRGADLGRLAAAIRAMA